MTSEEKVTLAIQSAQQVSKDQRFNNWANEWLTGKDRSYQSAYSIFIADVPAICYYNKRAAAANTACANAAWAAVAFATNDAAMLDRASTYATEYATYR